MGFNLHKPSDFCVNCLAAVSSIDDFPISSTGDSPFIVIYGAFMAVADPAFLRGGLGVPTYYLAKVSPKTALIIKEIGSRAKSGVGGGGGARPPGSANDWVVLSSTNKENYINTFSMLNLEMNCYVTSGLYLFNKNFIGNIVDIYLQLLILNVSLSVAVTCSQLYISNLHIMVL